MSLFVRSTPMNGFIEEQLEEMRLFFPDERGQLE